MILRNHAVVIASTGRPEVLSDTLSSLLRQKALPHRILVCVVDAADLPREMPSNCVEVFFGARGSSVQRNQGLRILSDSPSELITFLDDDVELSPDYFLQMNNFFANHTEIAFADGFLLKNGQVSRDQARALASEVKEFTAAFSYSVSGYGCNLTVRTEVASQVWFDERLRLYGWLEDADFSFRCLRFGKGASVSSARLVHLASPSGRVSGIRYGFAQVMNSYYLYSKCQMGRWRLIREHWAPALLGNFAGLFRHEPKTDRLGRLRGNGIAFMSLLRSECRPEDVEKLT